MNPLVKVTVQPGALDIADLKFVGSYQVLQSYVLLAPTCMQTCLAHGCFMHHFFLQCACWFAGQLIHLLSLVQVVLLVDESLERQQAWDEACTAHGTAFYSAASRGACTYLFANLHLHTFTPLVSGSIDKFLQAQSFSHCKCIP